MSDPSAADSHSSEAEGYEQPLADDPEVLHADEQPSEGPASVDGTAAILVKACDFGVTLKFGQPLTEHESHGLHRDLAAVLVKYDVPDIPFSEELTLACNVGGIVFRRAVILQQAQQQQQQHEAASDSTEHRQEGVGQNGVGTEAGFSSYSSEARDILS